MPVFLVKPGAPYSRNNFTACLHSCSKKGFKAVNISIANISCRFTQSATLAALQR